MTRRNSYRSEVLRQKFMLQKDIRVVITHNSENNKLSILPKLTDEFDYNANKIISVVEYSMFVPHLYDMREDEQMDFLSSIIGLVAKVSKLALNALVSGVEYFPETIQEIYLNWLHNLRRFDGNDIFMFKVRNLVRHLWHQTKLYVKDKNSLLSSSMVTEYIC